MLWFFHRCLINVGLVNCLRIMDTDVLPNRSRQPLTSEKQHVLVQQREGNIPCMQVALVNGGEIIIGRCRTLKQMKSSLTHVACQKPPESQQPDRR